MTEEYPGTGTGTVKSILQHMKLVPCEKEVEDAECYVENDEREEYGEEEEEEEVPVTEVNHVKFFLFHIIY